MDLNSAVQKLISAISGTKEYSELQAAKQEVSMNKEAASLLSQFLRKQEYLSNPSISPEQAQSLYDTLNNEYTKLNSIPVLARYFNASNGLSTLIDNIAGRLYEALDR